jgi:hypothetical protein
MSNPTRQRRPARIRTLAASTFAVLIAMSTLGMPTASASPQDDTWRLLNDQHVSAGCPGYGGDDALMQAAVQLAQTMSAHDGQVPASYLSTKQLLAYSGFPTDGFGEMRYFNANGATAQDAVDFWMNANTRGLPAECGLQQLSTAVFINNGKFTAVALMGTRRA